MSLAVSGFRLLGWVWVKGVVGEGVGSLVEVSVA